jgi:hypothetical protein
MMAAAVSIGNKQIILGAAVLAAFLLASVIHWLLSLDRLVATSRDRRSKLTRFLDRASAPAPVRLVLAFLAGKSIRLLAQEAGYARERFERRFRAGFLAILTLLLGREELNTVLADWTPAGNAVADDPTWPCSTALIAPGDTDSPDV